MSKNSKTEDHKRLWKKNWKFKNLPAFAILSTFVKFCDLQKNTARILILL